MERWKTSGLNLCWILLLSIGLMGACMTSLSDMPCYERECGIWSGEECGTCEGALRHCDATGHCVDPAILTWVPIAGGSFSMGSDSESANEQPVHTVTVPAFEMTMTEVTVSQYRECVASGTCDAAGTYLPDCNWNDVEANADHPVNCVYWGNGEDYCWWVGGRLPSEAEWEYAARSEGRDVTFPWGEEMATCDNAVMFNSGNGCGTGHTMAVCSKPAGNTAQGLCDMAGNVWERILDWYYPDYTGAPTDGSARETPPPDITDPNGIARGGGHECIAASLRTTLRSSNDRGLSRTWIGFRCVRDPQ